MAATSNHLLPLRTPQANTPRVPTTTAATPGSRRAISAEPTAITASGKRLSLSARRRIAVHPPSTATGAGAATLTPHAKAAFRSLDQRRAAVFTPRGRRRRSSLRDPRGAAGRETPRDVLRDLARALAPTSTVIETSSSSSPGGGGGDRPRDAAAAAKSRRRRRSRKSAAGDTTLDPLEEFEEDDDDDDEFPIERPRFSLPGMEDGDDDLDDLKPPRLSGLEEDNYTATSIELPRRAWSEGPLARFDRDRGSLAGSVRFSDYAGPELMSDAPDIDSGFFPPPALDDDDDDGDAVLDEQAMVERFEDARRQTVGGESDFGPIEIPDAGNDTTFLMAPVESPTRDQTTAFEEDFSDDDVGGPAIMDDYDDDGDNDDNNNNNDHSMNPADDSVAGLTGLIGGGDDGLDETTMLSHTADLTDRLLRPASASGESRSNNNSRRKKAAGKKISKHGIEYKSLPQGVIKRLATTFARTAGSAKINPDALAAVTQATDWFFEQLADDLQAYAQHAGRKTIDESDMVTLMRRQRQTSASTTPFALAQRHLPRELLQELRMPAPPPTKAPRKKAGRRVEVDDEEDAT